MASAIGASRLFDLRALGWKAFQDLCIAISSEVLQRPVQSFLHSRDGGRDAAFVGAWNGDLAHDGEKSTIQCKFIGKPNAKLSLSQLKPELAKVARLAQSGLAHDYLVMTNAGVSGEADAQICAAFKATGAKVCQVLSGDWIEQQLRTRPALRMMAPRVYGIGDLSLILDDRAAEQARYMLSTLGDDLRCFVPTAAHRQAVAALQEKGFALLLGDPAAGKSTIAATLALGALDGGCSQALFVSRPEQLDHWNPNEQQFLWVDDAFGPNQLDMRRVQDWNAELPRLDSAVRAGAKVVFTSRNYIWSAAKDHLRLDRFKLLEQSQVVIDVGELTATERAQILYNHVKNGAQPKGMVAALKPLLPAVAANPRFLPELARRLGDPRFTDGLDLDPHHIKRFVEEPIDFLQKVLTALDDASQAAIALIFLSPEGYVASPIAASEDLALVCDLHDVTPGAIRRAMEHLRDSLTLLVLHPQGPRWTFRHPTIADAFGALVVRSPERVALYVRGVKLARLVSEAACGVPKTPSLVQIPPSLYGAVLGRLVGAKLDTPLKTFLARRCDRAFLEAFVAQKPEVQREGRNLGVWLANDTTLSLLVRLHELGLLTEEARRLAVETLIENAMSIFEVGFFEHHNGVSLFTAEELAAFEIELNDYWLKDPDATMRRWREQGGRDGEHYLDDLQESLRYVENYLKRRPFAAPDFAAFRAKIDDWLDQLPPEEPTRKSAPTLTAPVEIQAIFEDIDG